MEVRWGEVFSLRGRIGRRTFWTLAGPLFLLLAIVAGMSLADAPDALEVWDTLFFFGFAVALVLAFFGVRRLHDRGISGKWMLLVVAPFPLAYVPFLFPFLYLAPFILLVFFVIVALVPGHEGPNEYGLPGSGSPFPGELPAPETAQRGDRR